MAKKEPKSKFDINFAENKALAERVAAHFVPRVRTVRNNRQPLEEAWWRFFNMWNVTKDGYHNYSGRANLYIPEVRKNVEAQARQLTKAAFPSEECFDVGPGLTGTKRGAQSWRSMHKWAMSNCSLPLKYFVAMRQECMLGTSPIYLPWRHEVRHEFRSRRNGKKVLPKKMEVELFNGPDFIVRDLFRWYTFNPKKQDLADGCFEVEACSLFDLMALERQGLLANFKEVTTGASNAYLAEEFSRDIMRAESMGIQLQYNMAYAGEAVIKKDEGDKPESDRSFMRLTIYADMIMPEACEDDEDPEVPIPMKIQIYGNNIAGLIQRNPFYHQRPPYVIGRYIQPNADEFYGQGIPWSTQFMQYEMNSKAEQGMDSATLALNPIAIVDPGLAGASNEFTIEPGAIWWASPQGVKLGAMPDTTPVAYQAIQQLRVQMADYSDRSPALPPQLMGKSRSATQSEIVQDSLNVDNWLFQMQNELSVLMPMLEQWEAITDQNMKEEQMVMILGRRAGDLKRTLLTRSDLLGRYTYQWKGASSVSNRQILARQMLDALKVYSILPPGDQQKMQFNGSEFFKILWSEIWQLPDADKILGSPEEMVTQDAQAENKMVEMGLEIEVLPNDDDEGHMKEHDKALTLVKDPTAKLTLMSHQIQHKAQMERKKMQAEQQQQMQKMQMQLMLMQAQGGGKGKSRGSGNRAQLSPNGSTGDMASGNRA
jgi:hypothetical protein